LAVFIITLFFANGYLLNLYFVVKNNAVQYQLKSKWCRGHCMARKLRFYELQKLAGG